MVQDLLIQTYVYLHADPFTNAYAFAAEKICAFLVRRNSCVRGVECWHGLMGSKTFKKKTYSLLTYTHEIP